MVAVLSKTEFLKGTPAEAVIPKWQDLEEEAEVNLDALYAVWQETIDRTSRLFQEHVYNNPNADEYDYRQHRMFLYNMLWLGEQLVMTLVRLKRLGINGTEPYVARGDAKLGELRETLDLWHGDPEHQKDIPESFKQSMRELAEGNVVDFDVAVTQQPHGVRVQGDS